MNGEKKNKKIIISAIVFIAIVIVIFIIIFKNCSISDTMAAIRNAHPGWLLAGAGSMCLFVCCESSNIGRVLRSLGYKLTFLQTLKYGASGFFFSGITPSASGGQPMQLYYMHRDRVHISHGSLSLLTELMGFQIVNIILAAAGLIYDRSFLADINGAIRVLLYIGIGISAVILLLLIILLFCPAIADSLERLMKIFCLKAKKKNPIRKIAKQMDDYREGAVYIKNHPGMIMKNLAVTAVQLVAMYSITYFVYRALGCSGTGWARIFLLQAVLTAGIQVVPLPGSVGAGEGGFKLVFTGIFLVVTGISRHVRIRRENRKAAGDSACPAEKISDSQTKKISGSQAEGNFDFNAQQDVPQDFSCPAAPDPVCEDERDPGSRA